MFYGDCCCSYGKHLTVLLSERKRRLILIDVPYPPVLRLVHATLWKQFIRSVGEATTPVR